jgi:molecular chaperone GrpE
MVDDHIKQALLSRFQTYLDEAGDGSPDAPEDTTDLYSLFVELAGLRSEVRTESRLVKDALDQFRAVFAALEAKDASTRQELERARAQTREREAALLRPLLLDIIDLRDRLLAALNFPPSPPPGRVARLFRRAPEPDSGWREGLRLTLRRLDQLLADRRVVPMHTLGRPFDPRAARVVGIAADSDAAPGTVTEEVRCGFLWDSQILRGAEVVVSKRAPSTLEQLPEQGERI